ncbi:MAG: hypothetical protein RR034_01475 [Bacteroidales bacterium]
MKKRMLFWLVAILLLGTTSYADTIRMMQYNLMYYTNTSGVSGCNSTTNNLNAKDVALKTILQYVQPDV